MVLYWKLGLTLSFFKFIGTLSKENITEKYPKWPAKLLFLSAAPAFINWIKREEDLGRREGEDIVRNVILCGRD